MSSLLGVPTTDTLPDCHSVWWGTSKAYIIRRRRSEILFEEENDVTPWHPSSSCVWFSFPFCWVNPPLSSQISACLPADVWRPGGKCQQSSKVARWQNMIFSFPCLPPEWNVRHKCSRREGGGAEFIPHWCNGTSLSVGGFHIRRLQSEALKGGSKCPEICDNLYENSA